MKNKRKKKFIIDYIKASRKKSREADLGAGFQSVIKVHKSKKSYNRKKSKSVDISE